MVQAAATHRNPPRKQRKLAPLGPVVRKAAARRDPAARGPERRPSPEHRPSPERRLVLADPRPKDLAFPKLSREELMVVAQVGYQYLLSGGYELASFVFSGLAELAPEDSYFHLALGLCRDHLGDKRGAHRAYARAGDLAPKDGRPDVNRAELFIEAGQLDRARSCLSVGLEKARVQGDRALENKARAILQHLERSRRSA